MYEGGGELPVKTGDVILVPPEEKHVTRNTGSEPLVLLCFFPTPDIAPTTENFPSF
jgi:oxalate decarboxylase/phosphoglucose isomerase-like protein (cupin superfamily)